MEAAKPQACRIADSRGCPAIAVRGDVLLTADDNIQVGNQVACKQPYE
jgi:hypothetical protein